MAEKNLEQMQEAVAEIREKMAAAAREAGRDPAADAAVRRLQDPHGADRGRQRSPAHRCVRREPCAGAVRKL